MCLTSAINSHIYFEECFFTLPSLVLVQLTEILVVDEINTKGYLTAQKSFKIFLNFLVF